ncbi:MAG: glyoxalase [Balneola sp.]|jgi:catechol 2,3-dioxygenase-like lactoylglutathione lyase family enzyme|nr:glyoxalase [Balneola sp.]MBE79693.1 glyoxalase [Balneola sp.]|tara:strand:- start:887 stop:1279 length:393 start_codon:yes stop_codon:yes gene_type:complete
MQQLSFDHYTIKVNDLAKSVNFYKTVLGLAEITNRTKKPHIRWLSLGSGELHIVERGSTMIHTDIGVHMALKLKDFEAFLSHMETHSIAPHNSKGKPNSITTRADGIRQVYFQDPDGYWIEVNEALISKP